MHGGKGSGAPLGNQNALKHGHYTAASKALTLEQMAILRELQRLIAQRESTPTPTALSPPAVPSVSTSAAPPVCP